MISLIVFRDDQLTVLDDNAIVRGANHGIIHVNSRFRRDARSMEEDEETWFDQGDEENGDEPGLHQDDLLDGEDREFKPRKAFISSKANRMAGDMQPMVNNKTVSTICLLPSNSQYTTLPNNSGYATSVN